MRKRPSRPRRFAAVDNDAIDTLPSILGVGLLTCLIRAKDGAEVNVETLSKDYEEGEKSLSKAMRSLVDGAYVVKFKIQRATTETVIEDGKEVTKRGGSWYTTFNVDSIPFTAADVAAMVEEIYAEGNVKSHRVEPTRLDPNKGSSSPSRRPTPPGSGVGPTRGNSGDEEADTADSEGRPTPPSGAPGRPTLGQGGAHIRKKTTSVSAADEQPEDEDDALAGRSPGDARRASAGSSACEGEGGFAASGKTSPSPTPKTDTRGPARDQKNGSKKAAHTREQLDVVRRVRAFYPPEIRDQLPELPAISEAILLTMAKEGRSVEQMGQRILSRWVNHNYAAKFAAGELVNVVGAAIGMVRPLVPGDRYACSDIRCEGGVLDGEPCRLCAVRIADWEAARARERAQGRPVGANSAPLTAGSPEPALPPQRAAQLDTPERVLCGGKGGTCTAGLTSWQTLCWECSEAAAEQHSLENAGAPAPF